LKENFKIYF